MKNSGNNNDFIKGIIYEESKRQTSKDVFTKETFLPQEYQQLCHDAIYSHFTISKLRNGGLDKIISIQPSEKFIRMISDEVLDDLLFNAFGTGNKDLVEQVIPFIEEIKEPNYSCTTKDGFTLAMSLVTLDELTIIDSEMRADNGHIIPETARRTDVKDLIRLALEKGENINAQNKSKETLLFTAITEGKGDLIDTIISRPGCDPNIGDKDGLTPLMSSILTGNSTIFTKLLHYNADITPKLATGSNALTIAADYNRTDMVRTLIGKGSSVNANDKLNNHSPLTFAMRNQNYEMAAELLKAGANSNYKNKDGDSPLCFAVKGRSLEMVELLIQHGAKTNYAKVNECKKKSTQGIRNIIAATNSKMKVENAKVVETNYDKLLQEAMAETYSGGKGKKPHHNQSTIMEYVNNAKTDLNEFKVNGYGILHLVAEFCEYEYFRSLTQQGLNIDSNKSELLRSASKKNDAIKIIESHPDSFDAQDIAGFIKYNKSRTMLESLLSNDSTMNIFINTSNKDRTEAFKICRTGDADRRLIAQFEKRMSDIHKTKQKLEKLDIEQLSNLIKHCQDDKMMDVILSSDTVLDNFVTATHQERSAAFITCNTNNKFKSFERKVTDIINNEIRDEVESVLANLLETVEPVYQNNEVKDVLTGMVNEVETSYNRDKFNDAIEELTDSAINKDLVAEILSFKNSKDGLIVAKSSNLAFIQNLIKETLQEKEASENLTEICERLEELFSGMNQGNESVESDLSPKAKPYVPIGEPVKQNALEKT